MSNEGVRIFDDRIEADGIATFWKTYGLPVSILHFPIHFRYRLTASFYAVLIFIIILPFFILIIIALSATFSKFEPKENFIIIVVLFLLYPGVIFVNVLWMALTKCSVLALTRHDFIDYRNLRKPVAWSDIEQARPRIGRGSKAFGLELQLRSTPSRRLSLLSLLSLPLPFAANRNTIILNLTSLDHDDRQLVSILCALIEDAGGAIGPARQPLVPAWIISLLEWLR